MASSSRPPRSSTAIAGRTWRTSPRRASTSVAASDGRYVYAVGGRELASDKNSPALERYDPGSDRWTKLPDMPTASGSVSAAVVGGRLITAGGETPTDVSAAVQAFDLTKQTWSTLPRMHTARHGVALAALGDSLYAIGGATAPGHVGTTRRAEVLDLSGAPSKASAARQVAGVAQCAGCAPVRRGDPGGGGGVGVRRAGRDHLEHDGEGVRPGDQRVEDGARPAVAAAPRDGGDLRGRAGRDRRLGAAGLGPDCEDLRPGVRPAKRRLGGAAQAQPRPGRRGGRRGGRQDRRLRRAGGRQAGGPDRGLRRRSLEGRGGHPHAARASRWRIGRPLRLRGRRPGAGVGQELAGARALRPRQRSLDRSCRTCRPRAAACPPRS